MPLIAGTFSPETLVTVYPDLRPAWEALAKLLPEIPWHAHRIDPHDLTDVENSFSGPKFDRMADEEFEAFTRHVVGVIYAFHARALALSGLDVAAVWALETDSPHADRNEEWVWYAVNYAKPRELTASAHAASAAGVVFEDAFW